RTKCTSETKRLQSEPPPRPQSRILPRPRRVSDGKHERGDQEDGVRTPRRFPNVGTRPGRDESRPYKNNPSRIFLRHSRGSGNPVILQSAWTPAFAGVTQKRRCSMEPPASRPPLFPRLPETW